MPQIHVSVNQGTGDFPRKYTKMESGSVENLVSP